MREPLGYASRHLACGRCGPRSGPGYWSWYAPGKRRPWRRSHASEDKEEVAIPLRNALVAQGISVWLDRTELVVGDSLRRKIDQGIRSSRFGIVVLSKHFFAKGWTNHELDGLVTRTVAGEQTLLPIWHGITATDVRSHSPSLADKVALATDNTSTEEMADQIARVVRGGGVDAA